MKLTAAVVERIRPKIDKHRVLSRGKNKGEANPNYGKPVRTEVPDSGSKGLWLLVQPSGQKSWVMRFRGPRGKPVKYTVGPANMGPPTNPSLVVGAAHTLAEARAHAAKINVGRASGQDVVTEAKQAKEKLRQIASGQTDTFAEVAKAFAAGHKVKTWREIATNLGLKYGKEGGEPIMSKGGLAERWVDKPVGEITGHDVHAVIAEAIKYGTPGIATRKTQASENRGRKMANALGSLFKFAMRHRRHAMKANPCIGEYRPGSPPPRDRTLSAEEIIALWGACEEATYPFGSIVRMLLLTGCRLKEVSALEWKELDKDLSSFSLPGRRTKNGLPHVVHLAPQAREIIKKAKRIEGCPYVFSITGSSPVSGWSKVKQRLDDAMTKRNGGEALPPFRLHDLRRTAATGMAEIGVPPHIVEATLNHVSGARAGVAGTYNRAVYAAEKKAALERWATHVEGIVTGKPANVVALRTIQRAT